MFRRFDRERVAKRSAALIIALLVAAGSTPSLAADSPHEDEPPPDSATDLRGSLEGAMDPKPVPPKTRLWHRARTLTPFLRDTQLSLKLRSYYFDRTNTDGSESEAWAGGGSLAYQSGRWRGFVSIGAELFTSQRIYGPRDRDGTRLLRPRQIGLTVLGKAFVTLHYKEILRLRLYRQDLELPYLDRQDSRMIPNAYEAYMLRGQIPQLDFGAGHVTQVKRRDSRDFISMAEAAGVDDSKDRGLSLFGLRYRPREGVSIGAIDYYAWDVMNILYAEAEYTQQFTDEIALKLSGQFTHQRSIGEELLAVPSFDTYVWGLRAAASLRSGILTLAMSSTSDDAAIRSPYGGYPGYLSMMRVDFNRAGELAWLVGFSYDFKRIGVPGLTAFTKFARGTSARDSLTGASLPNRQEFDVTADYRVPEGRLKGFWIRLRYAFLDVDGDADPAHDFRAILNYEIPLL